MARPAVWKRFSWLGAESSKAVVLATAVVPLPEECHHMSGFVPVLGCFGSRVAFLVAPTQHKCTTMSMLIDSSSHVI